MLPYIIFSFLTQIILQGSCETPKTFFPTTLPQTTEFLYGRAVCERYSSIGNFTRPEIIVCPKGIKFCYSSVYVLEEGESHRLKIQKRGCWSKFEASEGDCTVGSCLVGRPVNKNAAHSKRTCCCRGFACNKNTTYVNSILKKYIAVSNVVTVTSQTPAKRHHSRVKDISPKETVILGVISSVFATFLILSIVFVSWRCAARKDHTLLPKKRHVIESAVEEAVEYSTISNDDIVFGELINKGSFSTVWKCDYEGSKVAIKIFTSKYDGYWKNERRIYDILGVHPNIALVLAGVELVSAFSARKALIMKLYTCGSLFQYLKSHTLSWNEMYKLISSLANGVAFIHGEIDEYDKLRRTVIVHRNLNSCNVLVKEDGTCALSGFDVAVHITGQEINEKVEHENVIYMPPEVLANAVNWHDWESSLKQVDVYSLGLIFWEIVTRCRHFYDDGLVPDANLPYVAELGETPCVTTLEEYISKQRKRPVFPPERQASDRSFSLLKNTIEECWDVEPEARLTALCVVKRMQEIYDARNDSPESKEEKGTLNDLVEFSSTPAESTPGTDCKPEDLPLVNFCYNKNEMFPLNGNRYGYSYDGQKKTHAKTETQPQDVKHANNCTEV